MTPQATKRRITWALIAIALALLALPLGARWAVNHSAEGRIYTDINAVPKARVALVLGCKVHRNGALSALLADRVRTSARLYKAGKVEKLLMSGDNRFQNYNEPERMRDYAIQLGVPPKDIALDYAGRRTYDSVHRARFIFGQTHLIVVSQEYHLPRALYLCRHDGIDAAGVAGRWPGQPGDWLRETFADLAAVLDTHLRHPRPIMGRHERI